MRAAWLVVASLAPFYLPLTAAAQQDRGVIAGTVTDVQTKAPISGALVQIEGTRTGVQSGANGTYRIPNVPVGPRTVSARILGYAKVSSQVTVLADSTVTVDFALEHTVSTLDAVVVTGTPMASSKREIGNAVGIVNASEIVQLARE